MIGADCKTLDTEVEKRIKRNKKSPQSTDTINERNEYGKR